MYIPTQFKRDDVAAAIELMRKHSFATLICNDDDGQPFVAGPVSRTEARVNPANLRLLG
jgi:predicted FMN-binding regulatory protein PaiB